MIKTMLLTAQLALSPIVGTNGLQPKQLPNPVYGEEVNLSVTHNGESYTRLAYVNEQTYGNFDYRRGTTAWLNFNLGGINPHYMNNAETNMGTGDGNTYLLLMLNDDGNQYFDDVDGKVCLSFYGNDTNQQKFYYEVFSKDYNYSISIYKWTTDHWEVDETNRTDASLGGYQMVGFFLTPPEHTTACTLGDIPQYQPTTANPSIYDNIYSFYYQNLFANEALDELGAEVGKNSMTMRQWLAHTATIISISLLSAALVILVIKIFKLIAGSISDIWG